MMSVHAKAMAGTVGGCVGEEVVDAIFGWDFGRDGYKGDGR